MRFRDKVALISGAGSGIGRATAQMIGAEGGTVVGVDLDQTAVEQIMDGIRRAGGTAHALVANALEAADVARAIAPSRTLSERIHARWEQMSEAEQAAEIARTPLRRIAQPEDQARVICFLASADADFVTGVTIDVTGGQ